MLGAVVVGIDASRKEEQCVQTTGKVAVHPLSVVFEMVFGKVVLNGGELVLRQGYAIRAAGEDIPARQLIVRIQPGEKLKCCGIFEDVYKRQELCSSGFPAR